MPNYATTVQNQLIEQRVFLARFENATYRDLLVIYREQFDDIAAQLQNVLPDYAQRRLRGFWDQTRTVLDETARMSAAELDTRLRDVRDIAAQWMTDALERSLPTALHVPFDRLDEKALIAAYRPRHDRAYARLPAEQLVVVQKSIGVSAFLGESVPQAEKRLKRELGANHTHNTRTIVRTEIQRVSNDVQRAQLEHNKNYLSGVRWLATLDDRTCLICGPLDGRVWSEPRLVDPYPPAHPNCRCVVTPVAKSLDDIFPQLRGIDSPDTRRWRASMDGELPARTDWARWVTQKDATDSAMVRDILGPTRYDLWKAGRITLRQFSTNGRTLTIPELLRITKTKIKPRKPRAPRKPPPPPPLPVPQPTTPTPSPAVGNLPAAPLDPLAPHPGYAAAATLPSKHKGISLDELKRILGKKSATDADRFEALRRYILGRYVDELHMAPDRPGTEQRPSRRNEVVFAKSQAEWARFTTAFGRKPDALWGFAPHADLAQGIAPEPTKRTRDMFIKFRTGSDIGGKQILGVTTVFHEMVHQMGADRMRAKAINKTYTILEEGLVSTIARFEADKLASDLFGETWTKSGYAVAHRRDHMQSRTRFGSYSGYVQTTMQLAEAVAAARGRDSLRPAEYVNFAVHVQHAARDDTGAHSVDRQLDWVDQTISSAWAKAHNLTPDEQNVVGAEVRLFVQTAEVQGSDDSTRPSLTDRINTAIAAARRAGRRRVQAAAVMPIPVMRQLLREIRRYAGHDVKTQNTIGWWIARRAGRH